MSLRHHVAILSLTQGHRDFAKRQYAIIVNHLDNQEPSSHGYVTSQRFINSTQHGVIACGA